ncbi:MAG: hypothetical protein DRO76_01925, partial [Candidatus Altiarchaeales archaeon]
VNSTENISLLIFLNGKEVEIENITFNSSAQAFDIVVQIPTTSVENVLKIECSLLPYNYSTQIIKERLIFVNDTILPTIQETREFVLENKTLLMLRASDNDVINSTIANVTYPDGNSIEAALTFNSSTGYFENTIETSQEGDYMVEYIVTDASNNTNKKIEWFRVSSLIHLSGSLDLSVNISFYQPATKYKFKEFTINGSYNETLRAGDYDIDLSLEGVNFEIFNSTLNKSLFQPIELDKPPISIFVLPLTKNRFESIAYAFISNFSKTRVYLDFSSYVDKVMNMNDLRVYVCKNYSFKERVCNANFTTLIPSIDYRSLKASIELNDSNSMLIFAEGIICGNGVCESVYGETYQNCPQDCPQPSVCGNGVCEFGETCENCPEDCGECPMGAVCGNGDCEATETCENCPQDCGECPMGGRGRIIGLEEQQKQLENISKTLSSIENKTKDIREITERIWQMFKRTNSSVIRDERITSYRLSKKASITIQYNITVPIKEGYSAGEYLPLKWKFWFVNDRNVCIDQGGGGEVEPQCRPLIAETIGRANDTIPIEIKIRPSLNRGNYSMIREFEVDPEEVWVSYGREIIAQIEVVEDNLYRGVEMKKITKSISGIKDKEAKELDIIGMMVRGINDKDVQIGLILLLSLVLVTLISIGYHNYRCAVRKKEREKKWYEK